MSVLLVQNNYSDLIFKNYALTQIPKSIVNSIQENFAVIRLSGNLVNTMQVSQVGANEVQVHIPAKCYDIKLFKEKGVIVYGGNAGHGSYAEKVNYTGGFSKTHKNYVNIALLKATFSAEQFYRTYNCKVSVEVNL